MPKHEQVFNANANEETMLAVAYEAFLKLKWVPTHAGNQRLLGEELGTGFIKNRQILVTYDNGNIIVSSETMDDQVFDIGGRNKKNVAQFISAYNELLPGFSEEKVKENIGLVDHIKLATAEVMIKQQKQSEEIEITMKMGSSNLYVTYAIIAINVIVFILMAMNGAGIMEASGLVHLKWGSNFGPLTLTGDWWRLFTNIFIHFGIIHLAMNMYALYTIGIYLEPMLGKVKYSVAYVCTGLLASLASLWWHYGTPVNSAGASGAIFGLYGLFLAMLTTKLIPESIRKGLLTNIAIFVGYNLIYGVKGGIDNSAHIGGLLSGFVIGYLYVFSLKKEKEDLKVSWVLPAVIAFTLAGCFGYIELHKGSMNERTSLENELHASSFKDMEKFSSQYDAMIVLQKNALAPLNDTTAKYDETLLQKLNDISVPSWEKAEDISVSMEKLDVADNMKEKLKTFQLYITQRQQEIDLVKERIRNPDVDDSQKWNNLTKELDETLRKLKEP